MVTAQGLTESDLGRFDVVLGRGGQSIVYDLPEVELPDATGSLVYKRYRQGSAPPFGLRELIDIRSRLRGDPEKLAILDSIAAWPLREVVDSDTGAPCGLIIPRIPDSFFHILRLPSGKLSSAIREVQFLFISPEQSAKLGLANPDIDLRLRICRDLAGSLAFLHGPNVDVVFGDINARNAVFRFDSEPTIMLVDCDAVRSRGSMSAVPQLNAPDWDAPDRGSLLNRQTDLYKLGLFILRALTPGRLTSVNRDPRRAASVLDETGLSLLTRAIKGVPEGRPTAQHWYQYFNDSMGGGLRLAARGAAVGGFGGTPTGSVVGGLQRDSEGRWRPMEKLD